MRRIRVPPSSWPAWPRAKPTASRLTRLAPTSSSPAVLRVSSSRVASSAVRGPSARTTIDPTATRKTSALASQPAIRASSHVRGAKSTSPTVNPMDAATTSRRRGGACHPNHRWYVVSGGIAAIGSGLSDLDGSVEPSRPTAGRSPHASRLTSKLGGEVMCERLPDGRHSQRVAEHVTVDREVALDRRDLLGGAGAADDNRPEPDRRALEGTLGDLRDAGRVGEDDLDPPPTRDTPVTRLRVKRSAVTCVARPLSIGEERLADMGEADALVVLERLDRRILTATPTRPGPQQNAKRRDVGMQRWAHPSSVTPGCRVTTARAVRFVR